MHRGECLHLSKLDAETDSEILQVHKVLKEVSTETGSGIRYQIHEKISTFWKIMQARQILILGVQNTWISSTIHSPVQVGMRFFILVKYISQKVS